MAKAKLNLSIDDKLKKDFKHIALTQDTTCSDLVELYIAALKVSPQVLDALTMTIDKNKNNSSKNKKTR